MTSRGPICWGGVEVDDPAGVKSPDEAGPAEFGYLLRREPQPDCTMNSGETTLAMGCLKPLK